VTKKQRQHWQGEASRIERRIVAYWTGSGGRAGFYGSFVMEFAKRYADARCRDAKKNTSVKL
jgi:hypothetical protein